MKAVSCGLIIALLVTTFVGCHQSAEERAYDLAIEGLQARISRGREKAAKIDTDPRARVQQDFVLPSDQAALKYLESAGPSSLKNPRVLWGVIRPVMAAGSNFSHFLQLEWLETGFQASGFYLTTSDGKIIKFQQTIDLSGNEFAQLAAEDNPSRYYQIGFSQSEKSNNQTVLLTAELYRKVIEERQVERVGLILTDGTLTEPGPLAYQED